MKYLVYFTTHKTAPLGATKSMKGYSCQCITHVRCCIKRKLRENIKVCVNVLPTSYQQVTDTLPTVSRLSADCWPTVSWQVANISGKTCQPSVGQLSADKRPTVDWQSADRFFGELLFTITNPSTTKSDQHMISLSISPMKSNIKGLRIIKMINNYSNSWLISKFSLVAPWEM